MLLSEVPSEEQLVAVNAKIEKIKITLRRFMRLSLPHKPKGFLTLPDNLRFICYKLFGSTKTECTSGTTDLI